MCSLKGNPGYIEPSKEDVKKSLLPPVIELYAINSRNPPHTGHKEVMILKLFMV